MSGNIISCGSSTPKEEDQCDFCGKFGDVVHHTSVPDRFGFYNFCRTGPCYSYYFNFVYHKDLSSGLPFSTKIKLLETDLNNCALKESTEDPCDFCGSLSNVINYKDVPERFEHYNFCRYTRCYIDYDHFIYRRDLSAGIPYSIKVAYPTEEKNECHKQCAYCGRRAESVLRV